jgi:hypothetical protein
MIVLINKLKKLLGVIEPEADKTLEEIQEKWKRTLERIDSLEKLLNERKII